MNKAISMPSSSIWYLRLPDIVAAYIFAGTEKFNRLLYIIAVADRPKKNTADCVLANTILIVGKKYGTTNPEFDFFSGNPDDETPFFCGIVKQSLCHFFLP
jgi:hypothetical protein